MSPTNTYIVSILALGEGWHNYHHVININQSTLELN